jgi:cold shock CspA family protein
MSDRSGRSPSAIAFAGKLKRWKVDRGFGFVQGDDGRDAFLHISTLRAAGLGEVPVGTRVCFNAVVDTSGKARVSEIALEPPRPSRPPTEPPPPEFTHRVNTLLEPLGEPPLSPGEANALLRSEL